MRIANERNKLVTLKYSHLNEFQTIFPVAFCIIQCKINSLKLKLQHMRIIP